MKNCIPSHKSAYKWEISR